MLQKHVTYVHSNLSHHLVVLNSEMEGLHYVNIGKMQITANYNPQNEMFLKN